jgi:hypothetical protein
MRHTIVEYILYVHTVPGTSSLYTILADAWNERTLDVNDYYFVREISGCPTRKGERYFENLKRDELEFRLESISVSNKASPWVLP